MAGRVKRDIDGDLVVAGNLTVLGGLNEKNFLKTRTELASTKQDVSSFSGRIDEAESKANAASLATYNYANNVAPTNNVTELAFTEQANSDGSVDIPFSFKYTHGAVPAAGFLVFAKSGTSAPAAIDLAADAAAKFIPASSEAGELTYADTLRALSIRFGGAGALLRHYRFAVVAVSQCVGGAIPHTAGVVEVTSDSQGRNWTDKTFTVSIGTSEGNVMLSLEDQSIVFRDKTTLAELARMQYDESTGLVKAGKAGSPPDSGLSVPVKFSGSWVNGTWSLASTTALADGTYYASSLLPNGKVIYFYDFYTGTGYAHREWINDGRAWSAATTYLTETGSTNSSTTGAVTLADGRVLIFFTTPVSGGAPKLGEVIRSSDGSSYTPIVDAAIPAGFIFGLDKQALLLPDGSVYGLFSEYSGSYLCESIRSVDGAWSTPQSTVIAHGGQYAIARFTDGRIVMVMASGGNYVEYVRSTVGVWSGPSIITSTYRQWINSSGLSIMATPSDQIVLATSADEGYTPCIITGIRETTGIWSIAKLTTLSNDASYCLTELLNDGSITGFIKVLSTAQVLTCSSRYADIPIGIRFAKVGMGAIEHGIDANNYEYLVLGDGTKIYIDALLTAGGTKLKKKIKRFTSTGTWTCPDGVYSVEVLLVGGGGGGWTSGSMGGAGAVVRKRIPVTPGTTYTVTIGAGGAIQAVGGTTSFGSLLYAYGGGTPSAPTNHGQHGTDSATGITSAGATGNDFCCTCDAKDAVYGGVPPGTTSYTAYNMRITAAVANKGTAGATNSAGYSGYAEVEWEE